MIQFFISALTALAGLTSGRAAWLWFLASKVDGPKKLEGFEVYGSRAEGGNRVIIDTGPIIEFVKDSGQKNTAAAQWSAGAAFLGLLAGMLSAYVASLPAPLHTP